MPVLEGLNISAIEDASESDSTELSLIVETQEEKIEDLQFELVKAKRRLLSAELKIRTKRKEAKAVATAKSRSTLTKSPSTNKLVTQSDAASSRGDAGGASAGVSGTRFLEQGKNLDEAVRKARAEKELRDEEDEAAKALDEAVRKARPEKEERNRKDEAASRARHAGGKRSLDDANAESAVVEQGRLNSQRRFQEREQKRLSPQPDKGKGIDKGKDSDKGKGSAPPPALPAEERDRSGPPALRPGMSEDQEIDIIKLFHLGLRPHNPQVEAVRPDLGTAYRENQEITMKDV